MQNLGQILSRKKGIERFQELFKRSLQINPGRWQQAVERVWEYYPDDSIAVGIVPQDNKELIGKVMRYLVTLKGQG